MAKPWTTKEINVLKDEYSTGGSIDIVAKKFDRTDSAVYAKMRRLGISPLTYPKSNADAQIKCKYGLSSKDWDSLFNQQRGCCPICGKHQSELSRRFDTDHNKITNIIRGLLCGKCNRGIGMFDVDSEGSKLLIKAVQYIGGK